VENEGAAVVVLTAPAAFLVGLAGATIHISEAEAAFFELAFSKTFDGGELLSCQPLSLALFVGVVDFLCLLANGLLIFVAGGREADLKAARVFDSGVLTTSS